VWASGDTPPNELSYVFNGGFESIALAAWCLWGIYSAQFIFELGETFFKADGEALSMVEYAPLDCVLQLLDHKLKTMSS
jgi:hypothetical protein